MSNHKDPYEILGVSRNANRDEITKAYRKLASECHPDVAGADHDRFKDVAWAREILSDDAKRKHFDATGSTENNTQAEIEAVIAELVVQAFSGGLIYEDPISSIKNQIDRRRSECKQDKARIESRVETLNRRLATFSMVNAETTNTEARDFIINVIESQIEGLQQAIQQADHEISLGTRLLTYLNDIRYQEPGKARSFDRDANRLHNKAIEYSSWIQ